MLIGQKHWNVVMCYIPSSSTNKINLIVAALGNFPDEMDPILLRYINVDLYHPGGR